MGTPVRTGPPAFMAALGLTASPGSASPILQPETQTPESTANSQTGPLNGICVFSGGTAANSLVDAFQAVASHMSDRDSITAALASSPGPGPARQPCSLTYIIPISDNGGSSSELIRFFGGPSVGDIRSRLVRLIPTRDDDADTSKATETSTNERAALRALFEHRLCSSDPNQARIEWLDLVEARHLLWTFVPSATRELIRAVLNTLNLEIVKRARPSTSVFNFAGASVGNLFLTGARLFSGSFEAAIYLLSLLCGIPDHVAVLPSINSNFTHHISAGLADGTTIAGQVNISHPSAPTSLPDGTRALHALQETQAAQGMSAPPTAAAVAQTAISHRSSGGRRERASTAVDFEDATLPGSLPVLRQPQLAFSKEDEEDLQARIARVWYINPYGHEIRPQANPKTLAALRQAEAIIYSIGSLYTSIVPSLVLRGIGAAIEGSRQQKRKKILILNSKLDRETGPHSSPMTAADFVRAIVGACKQSQSDFGSVQDDECQRYVTHLVYLEPEERRPAGPRVDKTELGRLGVQCVGVPSQASRKGADGLSAGTEADQKLQERYDEAALTQTLEGLLDGSWDRPGHEE
ncbi:hypothetical protein F503_00976 [Ophiostoma piceae UAMH 11346]|uniref:Uncharacterized protein n=1 Tax=Ophiostoma piceae (strain UAMH 11346) TaxID=1262450 RepID=S3CNU7_OPHP1|nr:hypothetical protein F503_00976 [Ophiostoma piceae UAMH 11346]